jgi:large subunit ribosomal protein L6e
MVKWYPTEEAPKKHAPQKQNPTRLRGAVQPGQVLILLAGKHQGKRVVFLKQLPSGELLVTGPYKVNGVPLKRLPQSYTIATSTKVDVAGVDTSAVDDKYFKKDKKKVAQGEEAFFAPEKKKKEVPEHKKSTQHAVDAKILANLKKNSLLKKYLSTKFKLSNGVLPHKLKF